MRIGRQTDEEGFHSSIHLLVLPRWEDRRRRRRRRAQLSSPTDEQRNHPQPATDGATDRPTDSSPETPSRPPPTSPLPPSTRPSPHHNTSPPAPSPTARTHAAKAPSPFDVPRALIHEVWHPTSSIPNTHPPPPPSTHGEGVYLSICPTLSQRRGVPAPSHLLPPYLGASASAEASIVSSRLHPPCDGAFRGLHRAVRLGVKKVCSQVRTAVCFEGATKARLCRSIRLSLRLCFIGLGFGGLVSSARDLNGVWSCICAW